MRHEYRVQIRPDVSVSVQADLPAGPGPWPALILAHGQINDLNYPLLVAATERAAQKGWLGVRFNFPYREAGLDRPDANELLNAGLAAVTEDALKRWPVDPNRLAAGGKSLGARVSAQALAEGLPAKALVFMGFPLHPPNRPDLGREDLIRSVARVPLLFFAGTRDHLCPLGRLRDLVADLAGQAELQVVDGGDHSFRPLPESGENQEAIDDRLAAATMDWLMKTFPG